MDTRRELLHEYRTKGRCFNPGTGAGTSQAFKSLFLLFYYFFYHDVSLLRCLLKPLDGIFILFFSIGYFNVIIIVSIYANVFFLVIIRQSNPHKRTRPIFNPVCMDMGIAGKTVPIQ